MKTIIAGSRDLTNALQVIKHIQSCPWVDEITEVVSGHAKGVDSIGEKWATNKGLSLKLFHAHWSEFGKRAGMIRNVKMADYADALIAICKEGSNGTMHMIEQAKKNGLKVYEVHL